MSNEYKVRVITSKKCPKCKVYVSRLRRAEMAFETYDSDAQENQPLLDQWKIEEVPVVQILSSSGAVAFQFPTGTFSPRAIKHKIAELNK